MSTPLKLGMGMGLGALLICLSAGLGACGGFNPVHSDNVDALGPETGNADQYHRAGQPCTVCHGPDGPAKTQFTLAGTIFQGGKTSPPNSTLTGSCGAQVLVVDSIGNTPIDPTSGKDHQPIMTNCVGNFATTSDGSDGFLEFNPAFPVKVSIVPPGTNAKIPMLGPINREPSCGKCHQDPPYLDSPGVVTGIAGTQAASCSQCPTNPVINCPANGSCLVPGGALQ
jgi:hypothetical protein